MKCFILFCFTQLFIQESTNDNDDEDEEPKSALNDEDDGESGEVLTTSYDSTHTSCIVFFLSVECAAVCI